MVIRPRRNQPTPERSITLPLGRLLVTIDDLQSLLDLLNERREDGDPEIVVICDEGEFTEAEDMRRIGDAALENLRIDAKGITIHLAATRATAVGEPDLSLAIKRSWARPRETDRRPSTSGVIEWLEDNPFAMLITLAAVVTSALIFLFWRGGEGDTWIQLPTLLILTTGIIVAFIKITANARQIYDSYAIIIPLTKHEQRERDSKKTRVPLWQLIVAVLAFLVLLTFNVLNYMARP